MPNFQQVASLFVILLLLAGCTETQYDTNVREYEARYAYIPKLEANGKVVVINTATSQIVDSVFVGTNPTGLAISDDGSRVYVTLRTSDTDASLVVINAHTNSILDHATVSGIGIGPAGAIYHETAEEKAIYVTHNLGVTKIIDNGLDTLSVQTPAIPAKYNTGGIEIYGKYLITTGSLYSDDARTLVYESGVTLIDTTTGLIIDNFALGAGGALGIAVNNNTGQIFVSNRLQDTISVLSISDLGITLDDTITLTTGSGPAGIAYDDTYNRLYIAKSAQFDYFNPNDSVDGSVGVYDLNSGSHDDYRLVFPDTGEGYLGSLHVLLTDFISEEKRLYVVSDDWTQNGGVFLSAINSVLTGLEVYERIDTRTAGEDSTDTTKPQFVGRFVGPVCNECPEGPRTTLTGPAQAGIHFFTLLLLGTFFTFSRRYLWQNKNH